MESQSYLHNLDTYCKLYVAAHDATEGWMDKGEEAHAFKEFKKAVVAAYEESYLDGLEEDCSDRLMRMGSW